MSPFFSFEDGYNLHQRIKAAERYGKSICSRLDRQVQGFAAQAQDLAQNSLHLPSALSITRVEQESDGGQFFQASYRNELCGLKVETNRPIGWIYIELNIRFSFGTVYRRGAAKIVNINEFNDVPALSYLGFLSGCGGSSNSIADFLFEQMLTPEMAEEDLVRKAEGETDR